MSTCWDNPEHCRGCSYCEEARATANDPESPVIYGDLTPLEAHLRDRAWADQMARAHDEVKARAEARRLHPAGRVEGVRRD